MLHHLHPEQVEVEIWRADALEVHRGLSSELDKMWSYVPQQSASALVMARYRSPHGQGVSLCVWTTAGHGLFGTQSAVGVLWHHALFHRRLGAYERHVEAEQHTIGKAHTQKIESQPINLRTRIKRLVRRAICFSKTERMHDLVIGLFINRYEFGRSI
jgi:insertion element IS1 protein InsB